MDLLLVRRYKRIYQKFTTEIWEDNLSKKAERLRKLAAFRSIAPRNEKQRMIHNNLCAFIASIALKNNNDEKFLLYMNSIKRENEFELKFFILAVYYLSKNEIGLAENQYEKFISCNTQNKQLITVMEHFLRKHIQKEHELSEIIESFKNPVVRELCFSLLKRG